MLYIDVCKFYFIFYCKLKFVVNIDKYSLLLIYDDVVLFILEWYSIC